MKFVLLLTLWTADMSQPLVHVVDYDMTGADCIAAMEEIHRADPTNLEGIPSCEIDHAAHHGA